MALDVDRNVAQYLTCLALALLPSCVSPPPQNVEVVPGPAPSVELAVEQTPEPCGFVFSPAPELHDAAVTAAARWSAATGCDVRVGEGGLPVVLHPNPTLADGTPRRAVFDEGAGEIRYRSGNILSWTAETMLAHEFGHALGCHGHTHGGLMAEDTVLRAPIDADALACVCATLACEAFAPES